MLLRVGVLMGGMSIEREVSFNSGRTICDHLDTHRYHVIPVFQTHDGKLFLLPWHFIHRGKISDFEHRLASEAEQITWDDLKQRIDFAYIAMHGRYAEDGTLQGLLEVLGIPYLGSKVLASALRMDKAVHKQILRAHGIDVPRGIIVEPQHIINSEEHYTTILNDVASAAIQFPCIVKPHNEGSSLGVSYVENEYHLLTALRKACYASPDKPQAVLIEEKIDGMEFSCITLVNYHDNTLLPLPPTEIVTEHDRHFYDYEQKYMPGRALKYTPARCTAQDQHKIQETCLHVMRILGFSTMSRIDGFLTPDGRVVIIDPNTLSGMAPASFIFLQAAQQNMSHTDLINHLIETELQNYNMLQALILREKANTMHKTTEKIRIGVLFGGDSNEREISLESGRNVIYKLSPAQYDAIPLFVTPSMDLYLIDQRLLVHNSTHEIVQELTPSRHIPWSSLSSVVDFAFIALHGGKGENGSVQGTLEMLKIPYNGSGVLASALCMHKHATTEFLKEQGFDVPNSYLLDKTLWNTDKHVACTVILENLNFPVIVKPHDDGCSVMVCKATNIQELSAAVETIFAQNKSHALIEEFIRGMELTVGVLGNENPLALPPSQAVARGSILSIEEKFLPGAGENQTPAPLPAATLTFVRQIIARAYKVIGCKGYARIDCFYQAAHQSPTGKERVIILEINSLPALTPATCIFHQAAELGIKPMEFINTIIRLGFEEHQTSPHYLRQYKELDNAL